MRFSRLAMACAIVAWTLMSALPCRAFSVSPLKTQLTIAPGTEKYLVTIEVKNDLLEKQTFFLKILGAVQLKDGKVVYAAGSSEAENWVAPERESIDIGGGEEKKANFFVSVPEDAAAGSYYLGLAAESAGGGGSGQIGIAGQLVSVLLVQVAGVVTETLSIENWHMPGIAFANRWPAVFAVKNTSPVELPIAGQIIVRDWLGREVVKEGISISSVLLPGSPRSYTADILLSKGILLPGLYEAELRLVYGKTNQSAVRVQDVWYLPFYMWIVLAALVGSLGWMYKRKHKKKSEYGS